MSKSSSPRTERLLIALALLLVSLSASAFADRKDDLYNQALKAGSEQRLDESARLFCEVAKLDPGYKDATLMCKLQTQEAERDHKKSDDRFAEGVKAFQAGSFDEAEQKFRNVRSGSHVDEAKQYLAKIPTARQEKASGDAENAKFEQGSQAYERNDFATAKSLLGQINGKRAGDARNILNSISRYEQAMSAADAAAGSNPKQAVASYNDALAVKQDGPGDPRGKIARLQQQMTAAAATPSNPPASATPAGTRPNETAASAPKPKEVVAAVKDTRAAVDTAKLMREAQAAQAKGHSGLAKGKYVAVLAAEPGNAAARQALDALSSSGAGNKEAAGSEADVMLAKGIREFYTGMYEDAEVHIKDYLAANGSKTGLAQFYLGAIRVTRYYLAGAGDSDKKLLADATTAFRAARQTAGFAPPDQHVVSPKILKVFNETR